jgi:hypothetical protein
LKIVVNVLDFLGCIGFFGCVGAWLPASFARFFLLDYLFHIGIPFSARGTFAQPFRALSSAVLTEKGGFYFSHYLEARDKR